jgi:hypothetical protein
MVQRYTRKFPELFDTGVYLVYNSDFINDLIYLVTKKKISVIGAMRAIDRQTDTITFKPPMNLFRRNVMNVMASTRKAYAHLLLGFLALSLVAKFFKQETVQNIDTMINRCYSFIKHIASLQPNNDREVRYMIKRIELFNKLQREIRKPSSDYIVVLDNYLYPNIPFSSDIVQS